MAQGRSECTTTRYHPDYRMHRQTAARLGAGSGPVLSLSSSDNGDGPSRSSRAARKWLCAGLGQGAFTVSPLAWAAVAHGLPHCQITVLLYHGFAPCQGPNFQRKPPQSPRVFWISARASSILVMTSWISCWEMAAVGSKRMVFALTRVHAVITPRANRPLAHA